MGNRAIITDTDRTLAVYLHWNGGRDSVEGFVEYCRLKGYRSDDYGWARLCQVIGNFFGGGTSVGILPYTDDESMCSYGDDNGVYVVDMAKWEIVDRVYPWDDFVEQDGYSPQAMLEYIDERMPEHDRLGVDFLRAKELTAEDIHVGDTVFVNGEPHLVIHKLSYDEVRFKDLCLRLGLDVPAWAWEASKHAAGTPVSDWMLHAGCPFMENPNSYVDTRRMVLVDGSRLEYIDAPVRTKMGLGTIPKEIRDVRDGYLAVYNAYMDKAESDA